MHIFNHILLNSDQFQLQNIVNVPYHEHTAADTIILQMHFSFWQMIFQWHRHQIPCLPVCFVEIAGLVADDWHNCHKGCHLSHKHSVIHNIRSSCGVHHLDRPPHQVDLHYHPMPTHIARCEDEIDIFPFFSYVSFSPSTYPRNSSKISIVNQASLVGNVVCSIWTVSCEACIH